jgi:hypothetical protein
VSKVSVSSAWCDGEFGRVENAKVRHRRRLKLQGGIAPALHLRKAKWRFRSAALSVEAGILIPVVEFDLVFLLVLACRFTRNQCQIAFSGTSSHKEQHHGTGNR